MWIQTRPYYSWAVLNLLLLISSTNVESVNGLSSKKLDESVTGDPTVKCTPCTQHPPPSPPPPPPKKPPSTYCPPPPSPPSFIYMLGPPGNLYPIDQDFSGGSKKMAMEFPIFVLCGILLLGFLALKE